MTTEEGSFVNGEVLEFRNGFRPRLMPVREIGRSTMKYATQARAYFRTLRAAEMAAWEMTGGDFVISGVFGRTEDEPLAA